MSLSARRAWIEINRHCGGIHTARRRSPQGERGLKSMERMETREDGESLSARRAWIEIALLAVLLAAFAVALRKESVD